MGSTLEPGRSLGGGNGNLVCLPENPMDRGAWQATVHGVIKSQARLSSKTYAQHTQNTHNSTSKLFPESCVGAGCIKMCNEIYLLKYPSLVYFVPIQNLFFLRTIRSSGFSLKKFFKFSQDLRVVFLERNEAFNQIFQILIPLLKK